MFRDRTYTDYIVIHCSATRPSQDIGVEEIRRWHRAKGWLDIGYHFVIRRNGSLETGRPINKPGAHAGPAYNDRSIGICLVGGIHQNKKLPNGEPLPEDNFTPEQYAELVDLLTTLRGPGLKVAGVNYAYPKATILGHRDLEGVNKACPCFDVQEYLRTCTNIKPEWLGSPNDEERYG